MTDTHTHAHTLACTHTHAHTHTHTHTHSASDEGIGTAVNIYNMVSLGTVHALFGWLVLQPDGLP